MSRHSFFGQLPALLRDERGATAIEYALIGGLISIAIITGAAAVGSQTAANFNNVAGKIPTPKA